MRGILAIYISSFRPRIQISAACHHSYPKRRMEQAMEEEAAAAEVDFLSLEVDFDYEFDASRHFDFVREETPSEACEAELWFEEAGSYPPSPFISKLVLETDMLAETVNTLPKLKDSIISSGYLDRETSQEHYVDGSSNGFAVQNCVPQNVYHNEKRFVFGSSTRGSTLMKPTASHLAKQNHLPKVRYSHRSAPRLQKPLNKEFVKGSDDPFENIVQASKRQKLEGGHLWKIVSQKQQIELMHKLPQTNNKASTCKLRLTIPREPELETTQRAQRIKAHKFRSNAGQLSQEGKTPTTSTFKAHSLNKKILEDPSTVFPMSTPRLSDIHNIKLKTSESGIVATSSSLAASNQISSTTSTQHVKSHSICFQHQLSSTSRSLNDDQKISSGECILPKFTARPLNKKILSSKGDIGVFRSAKRDTTKPMEFNLSTNRRCHQDLPKEFFDKLSLKSGETSTTVAKPLWPFHGSTKVSKENVVNIAQVHKVVYENKCDTLKHVTKQFGFENAAFSYSRLEDSRMRKQERHGIR